jgi:hypothetical protein
VARIFFPRYLLFLTVPMALAGGYILSLVRGRLRLAAALSVFLFAPALLCGQIIFLAEKAPLPAVERWQYVSGWPSGYGTGELKEFLVSRADNQKVAVFAESFGIGEILKLYFYDREQVEINNVADGAMLAKTGDLLVLNFYPAAPGTWQVREIKRFCRVECESSIRVYEVE